MWFNNTVDCPLAQNSPEQMSRDKLLTGCGDDLLAVAALLHWRGNEQNKRQVRVGFHGDCWCEEGSGWTDCHKKRDNVCLCASVGHGEGKQADAGENGRERWWVKGRAGFIEYRFSF